MLNRVNAIHKMQNAIRVLIKGEIFARVVVRFRVKS